MIEGSRLDSTSGLHGGPATGPPNRSDHLRAYRRSADRTPRDCSHSRILRRSCCGGRGSEICRGSSPVRASAVLSPSRSKLDVPHLRCPGPPVPNTRSRLQWFRRRCLSASLQIRTAFKSARLGGGTEEDFEASLRSLLQLRQPRCGCGCNGSARSARTALWLQWEGHPDCMAPPETTSGRRLNFNRRRGAGQAAQGPKLVLSSTRSRNGDLRCRLPGAPGNGLRVTIEFQSSPRGRLGSLGAKNGAFRCHVPKRRLVVSADSKLIRS